MHLRSALDWEPPSHWRRISVVEAHTGGEPFRVAVEGLPEIPGDTVLEKRRYAQKRLDDLRRVMMWEPRGHADMYGGWPGPPVNGDSDLSVLFVHNEGFSTMCGHGIIALAKVVLDTGILPAESPETTLRIDTPAGLVVASSSAERGRVTHTSFRNVPSFVSGLDLTVDAQAVGRVRYDLAYGGAFYAFVEASTVGLTLDDAAALIETGRAIKHAVASQTQITHPEDADLGFLYGVIFTGSPLSAGNHSRHVCVFADGEVDRSPTGTGVSARLAILFERGDVSPGETVRVESIVGSEFAGRIVDTTTVGDRVAIIPEIGGSAHITGRAELWLDPDDILGNGFLLR
jgi:proline racemase